MNPWRVDRGVTPVATAEWEGRVSAARVIRLVVVVALAALLVVFVVMPQWRDAVHAIGVVSNVSAPLLLVGLGLELLSLCAYARLTSTALDPSSRPRFWRVARIDVAGVGISNSMPGGGPASLALRFHLLTRSGTPGSAAVGGITAEVVLSNLALGALFGTGLLSSVAALPSAPYYRLAGAFMVGVFGTAVGGLAFALARPAITLRAVHRVAKRLPGDRAGYVTRAFAQTIRAVRALAGNPRRFAAAVFWAATNWALDVASLWVMFAAFGTIAPLAPLVLVYALAAILALLPITPGGVGIVEGVMVPAFAAMGTPHGVAVLGVTAWRLVQYWMPMPLGAFAGASLMTHRADGQGVLRSRRNWRGLLRGIRTSPLTRKPSRS
ncbi:lysylphosphatidylglycerol synthase transmembrane domain-containing protein [Humibacter ginsengisoli]